MKNTPALGAGGESSSQMMQISQSESQSLMSSVDFATGDYEGNVQKAGRDTMGILESEKHKKDNIQRRQRLSREQKQILENAFNHDREWDLPFVKNLA